MKTFILTKENTGCPHSCTINNFDAEIVVPYEDKTYQYVIDAKSQMEEQIIVNRILEEFYQNDVHDCVIQIIGINLGRRMKTILQLLSKKNTIKYE